MAYDRLERKFAFATAMSKSMQGCGGFAINGYQYNPQYETTEFVIIMAHSRRLSGFLNHGGRRGMCSFPISLLS